ncbi:MULTISPECIES: hypothetical protein [Rhodanobacteraceae]|uniref:hypothetical protein n=1 Tax=Rhodanobacteraceae TaxID=1775411 RepID=UPI0008862D2C|nr:MULTISPECIES: hypothetical protein [Rhodanobacteraceae]SDG01553.1 hypothetical protein SAMN04515659_1893 [Dyella sp. 333MFSha]SKB30837.1 hypothetical protein SAMN05660880_00486 [Luteibacter sp. 22Crub2.1]
MQFRLTTVRSALAVFLVMSVLTGCAAVTETSTVKEKDTYDLWDKRMDHIPFVFHDADGAVTAFDNRGDIFSKAATAVEAERGRRVEIWVGHFSGPLKTLCSGAPASVPDAKGPTVVSALCDRDRSVVSFADRARERVIATRPVYIARARKLLLNGIWESVAQEPDPLPY